MQVHEFQWPRPLLLSALTHVKIQCSTQSGTGHCRCTKWQWHAYIHQPNVCTARTVDVLVTKPRCCINRSRRSLRCGAWQGSCYSADVDIRSEMEGRLNRKVIRMRWNQRRLLLTRMNCWWRWSCKRKFCLAWTRHMSCDQYCNSSCRCYTGCCSGRCTGRQRGRCRSCHRQCRCISKLRHQHQDSTAPLCACVSLKYQRRSECSRCHLSCCL